MKHLLHILHITGNTPELTSPIGRHYLYICYLDNNFTSVAFRFLPSQWCVNVNISVKAVKLVKKRSVSNAKMNGTLISKFFLFFQQNNKNIYVFKSSNLNVQVHYNNIHTQFQVDHN